MSNKADNSRIADVSHLEDLLSEPDAAAVDAMFRIDGDILVVGAGGKMGPTFCRMLKRASELAGVRRRIIAVSRFTNHQVSEMLRACGIEVISCDLLAEKSWEALPDAQNVVSMLGMKFGSGGAAATTWAMNTWLPSLLCRRFRSSQITAFSTGNVYPLVPVGSGGSQETDVVCPVGEYGMSALGRERIYEYFSRRDDTPTTVIRLNYAVEMRYGVLVDIARLVLNEAPVDLSMGYANVIWQGDASSYSIAAMAQASVPPFIINVAGPELLNVRDTAKRFAEIFRKPVAFSGVAAETALLSNSAMATEIWGAPRVGLQQLIDWTADWLLRGGVTHGKPTHFQTRDGRF